MDIEKYIKWCLIQLSTNLSIDHRNYCTKNDTNVSPLEQFILDNDGSFDKGIHHLAKYIESILIDEYKNEDEQADEDENEDEDKDADEESRQMFYRFIELSGLYEIKSLHGCSIDKFETKFNSVYIGIVCML